MKQYILAHDLGTTGNKATLYNAEGRLVSSAFYGYETEYARTGWAEQNPEDWWTAVCASTQTLLRQAGVRGDEIAAITFSGQMMGCSSMLMRNPSACDLWASRSRQEAWCERISPEDVTAQATG